MVPTVEKRNVLLHVVRTGVYLLLFSPLVFWSTFIYPHSSTKAHFVLFIAEVTVLVFAWLVWKDSERRPRLEAVGKSLLVFFAVLFIASLMGVDPLVSFWGTFARSTSGLLWLHLVLLFFIATSIFKTPSDWYRVFRISTFVGLLVGGIHFLSRLGMFDGTMDGSSFGNSTFFGTYLLFQIFFAIYLFFQTDKVMERCYAVVASLFFVFTLFSIDANAAQLSFIGGMFLCVSLLLISLGRSRVQHVVGFLLLGCLLCIFSFVFLSLFQPSSVVHEYFVEQTSNSRFVIWNAAWQGIQERPLFGWGLENFEFVALRYFHPCLGSATCGGAMWFDRAHNIFFDVGVDSGVIGLLAYGGIFIVAIISVWRSVGRQKQKSAVPAILTTILAVYFIQNLTSIDSVTSLLLFVLVLAAVSSLGTYYQKREQAALRHKELSWFVPVFATSIFPFAFFFFVVQPVQANRSIIEATAPKPMKEHLADYQQALYGSRMGLDRRRYFLSNGTADTLWVSPKESVMGVAYYARQEIQMAEEALRETIQRPHEDLRSYLTLGKLYQVEARLFDESRFENAEEVLKRAIELSPRNQLPKWALASVYLEQERFEEAVGLTEEALALDLQVEKSCILNIISLRFLGDKDRLGQAVEQAKRLHPQALEEIDVVLSVQDLTASESDLFHQFYQ